MTSDLGGCRIAGFPCSMLYAAPPDAQVAVFVKTIMRDHALFAAVRSYFQYMPPVSFRMYIADDGPVSEAKAELYACLREGGHFVLCLPKDTGASRARNLLLQELRDEKYVLRADDDFELVARTDIRALVEVLEAVPSLGAIAGLEEQIGTSKGIVGRGVSDFQGLFVRRGNTIVKQVVPLRSFRYASVGNTHYAFCDFARNLLLIRRRVFESTRWDERLRFEREHEDFMLQLARSGWRLAFSPDSIHRHREDLASLADPDYEGIRGRSINRDEAAVAELFKSKWGVEKIIVERPVVHRTLRHLGRLAGRLRKAWRMAI